MGRLVIDTHNNPADIWRQYDVGMTFDSDVGLTLQEGWKWKFSRRRILVGLVATKNQPDSNVFTTSDWSRPKINLIPTSLQRRVPAGLPFIKVRDSMKCVFPGLEVCEMSSNRQHAKISGNIKSIESIFMK